MWTKWEAGEPDGFANGIGGAVARCVKYDKLTGELADNNCNKAQKFVCHKGNYDIASVQII